MSWSASGTIKTYQGGQLFEMEYEQTQNENGEKESKLALQIAKNTALYLAQSGMLGIGDFKVNLSGHCNDENKPKSGWSNDCVTISISQIGKA